MATNAPQLANEIRAAMGFPLPVSQQLIGFAQGILEELTMNGIATFDSGIPGPHSISGMVGVSMATKVHNYAGWAEAGPTPQLINYCTGIVQHIHGMGIVTYVGPPPPAIPDYFLGGTISGLDGTIMANTIAGLVPYPGTSPELIAKCTAIVTHIMVNAEVVSGIIS